MKEIKKMKEVKPVSSKYIKLFMIIVLVLTAYFFAVLHISYENYIKAQENVAEIQMKIHEANTKRTKLKKQYSVVEGFMTKMKENNNDPVKAFGVLKNGSDYTETDKLVEETARKKFGYVKPNEIIFIDKNK